MQTLPRRAVAPRIGRAIAIVLTTLTAAGAALAQAPDQVQYLPRDGAALLLWTAPAGNVSGYNVYRQVVTDPATAPAAAVKVNAEPIKTTSYLVENLQNGTAYHFRVSAIVDGQESDRVGPFPAQGDQGEYVAVVPQKAVTLAGRPFYGHTIGTNYPGTHQVEADGQVRMTASGWDIQNDADGLYLLATPVSGDVTLTLRWVNGPTETANGTEWNLGGPIIRESLDSRSRLAMMQVARLGALQFKWREEFESSPPETRYTEIEPDTRPLWLRLVRRGNEFTSFISLDGADWKQVNSTPTTITDFAKEAYVGIALSAHDDSNSTSAVVDNVTITTP